MLKIRKLHHFSTGHLSLDFPPAHPSYFLVNPNEFQFSTYLHCEYTETENFSRRLFSLRLYFIYI